MNHSREATRRISTIVRRVLGIAILGTIILIVALFALFHSSRFQSAVKESMKENVPRGWFHLYGCLWTGCNPLKVVDPTDPRFEALKFQFEDYGSETQLAHAISQIVKPDMDRRTIDRILVESGHASIRETQEGRAVYYTYPDKSEKIERGVWVVTVYYPDRTHVERVWLHGNEVTSNAKDKK